MSDGVLDDRKVCYSCSAPCTPFFPNGRFEIIGLYFCIACQSRTNDCVVCKYTHWNLVVKFIIQQVLLVVDRRAQNTSKRNAYEAGDIQLPDAGSIAFVKHMVGMATQQVKTLPLVFIGMRY